MLKAAFTRPVVLLKSLLLLMLLQRADGGVRVVSEVLGQVASKSRV